MNQYNEDAYILEGLRKQGRIVGESVTKLVEQMQSGTVSVQQLEQEQSVATRLKIDPSLVTPEVEKKLRDYLQAEASSLTVQEIRTQGLGCGACKTAVVGAAVGVVGGGVISYAGASAVASAIISALNSLPFVAIQLTATQLAPKIAGLAADEVGEPVCELVGACS